MRAITLLPLLGCLSCSEDYPEGRAYAAAAPTAEAHSVTVHRPSALGVLDTTITNARGEPVGVGCATCHDAAEGSTAIADAPGEPEKFHASVKPEHGALACDSCHDADRTRLKLADGSPLDLGDALQLCAQCHGPQYRDYSHGAHGGMTGCWDLERCGRERNHCLDCHGAHNPKYPTFLPVFPPRDRHMGGEEHP